MQNNSFIRARVQIFAFLLLLSAGPFLRAQGQELLVPPTDSIALGSLPVLRESLQFFSLSGDTLFPNYQFRGGNPSYLLFEPALKDSLVVRFQSIRFVPPAYFALRDTLLILPEERRNAVLENQELYSLESSSRFDPFQALYSQGSLSRSIAVGNNQDAVLNSSLNLQLSGELGDNTRIRASISDNTVPVQAEGYTQQLRDFDRVYLELENPDFGMLRAGDYNIRPQRSTFLNFEKRISGGGLLSSEATAESPKPYRLQLEGGLARGRFARNRFQGSEGNQGPYKLRGNNGEQFIIIVSGSERVYIDGILQKRGQEYDYIIDYNAGEITFTALQPITRDKRIVVEFQYTEQNYLRSVFYGEASARKKNWQTRVQYYTEQDSKDQPLATELSDAEKSILAAAGDNLEDAFASTINPSAYNPGLIQYRLVDSLGYDSVLVFSTDSTANLYNASFAFVGAGKGDYRLISSNANGRVFEWLAPQGGVSQGSYAPVKTLVAPNRLQILNWQTAGSWGSQKQHLLRTELSASNNHLNLFSDRDQANDDGYAGKLQYRWQPQFKKGKGDFNALYQFNDAGFTTVERIYAVEFARDWNLPLNYQEALQYGKLVFGYHRDSLHLATSTELMNSSLRSGWRQSAEANWQDSTWQGSLNLSLTQTEGMGLQERFWRESLQQKFYWLPQAWLGLRSVGEWNLKSLSADSLAANSYSFFEYQVFQGFGDTNRSFLELGFLQRFDDSVRVKDLQPFTQAYTYFGRGTWITPGNGRFSAAVYYRNLQILQPEELALQRSLTSRFNYQQHFWDRSLYSQTFYESGAGTEPRRSFTFVEVPAGTGTHTHVDYNGNGIRELDEFEIAPTPDLATFVRVFSPNLEFLRTSILKFGQTFQLQAPRSWNSTSNSFKKWLTKLSMISSFQSERRNLLQGRVNELNPFGRLEADSLLVAQNQTFRQSVFYNRTEQGFGADYSNNISGNRNLLSFGIEERRVNAHRLGLRYGFSTAFILRYKASLENKVNRSGNFTRRNFDSESFGQELKLTYQQGQQLTLSGIAEWRLAESTGAAENTLNAREFGMELNYNIAERIALQSTAAYIRNDFEGDVNSPAAFEMLQAFRPGDNIGLSLTLQKTFLKNIVISLNYNGRFSTDRFAIHTGNVQVKAFL